jgi:hypothetical protein
MGLEHAFQELHEQGKQVEISWPWDGGIDVKAGDEESLTGAAGAEPTPAEMALFLGGPNTRALLSSKFYRGATTTP